MNKLDLNYKDPKPFYFKEFTVHHHRSAFKVNTDGVLLAAWARKQIFEATDILDIGTGSGVISIILASYFRNAKVLALDIDFDSVAQSNYNFKINNLENRSLAILQDFNDYKSSLKFDLIISNPPYFVKSTKPLKKSNLIAKHQADLNLETLIYGVSNLLSPNGAFFFILPYSQEENIRSYLHSNKLSVKRSVNVSSFPEEKPFNKMWMVVKRSSGVEEKEDLYIYKKKGVYSSGYRRLSMDLYLDK